MTGAGAYLLSGTRERNGYLGRIGGGGDHQHVDRRRRNASEVSIPRMVVVVVVLEADGRVARSASLSSVVLLLFGLWYPVA